MRKLLLAFLAVFFLLNCFAQGTYIPLNTESYRIVDRLNIKYSKVMPMVFTGDRPYYRGDVAKMAETLLLSNLKFSKVQQAQLQYLIDENAEWLDSMESKTRRPLWKKLYREPATFAHYSSKKKGLFDIRFNPVFDLKVGAESYNGRFVFSSVRGVEVRGNIKKVFSFYFNVLGNATRAPHFVANKYTPQHNIPSIYQENLYVPGQAYYKNYESKIFKFTDGADYFDARGYINVNVLKHLNISLGRDKFFIGDGQRSLFLSDFSAPYLFLKFDLKIWRFHYQSILAELTPQYIRGGDQLLPKKYMAAHHLNVQATHWLNIGLFEGVIMQRSNHFELQYLNPIMFYRTVEHAIGSPDNVLLGMDFKANAANHLSVYGQFLLDEFNFAHMTKRDGWWANKWALQLGLKYIDLLPNLDAQIEANIVRPFTYTHGSGIEYSHYNQPLAHPLGANFYEVILQLHYQPSPKLNFNLKYTVAAVGNDTIDASSSIGTFTNYGGDILRSTGDGTLVTRQLGNSFAQGARGTINLIQFQFTYSPWHNIFVDVDMFYRAKSGSKKGTIPYEEKVLGYESTFFFGVGLRMNIGPKTYDF